jgi:hypothetical protein
MPDLLEFGYELVAWVRGNFPWLADHLDRDTHIKDADAPYFLPDEALLDLKTSGKLVRLDVAVMAIHLMIARVYFRSLTGTTNRKLDTIRRLLAERSAVGAGEKLTNASVGRFLNVFRVLADLWQAEREQMSMEKAIRAASAQSQRELHARCLGGQKPPRRRKRRYVWSRHPKSK